MPSALGDSARQRVVLSSSRRLAGARSRKSKKLDLHFLSTMPALARRLHNSILICVAASIESAPETKSSTYNSVEIAAEARG